MTAPTMSQFATELDCLRARDKYHTAKVEQLERSNKEIRDEVDRLSGLLLQPRADHTHLCIHCHHAYTPGLDAETEDCPRCGCDGTKEWLSALSAADVNKGKEDA